MFYHKIVDKNAGCKRNFKMLCCVFQEQFLKQVEVLIYIQIPWPILTCLFSIFYRSMYNNGEYYQVTVARDGVNASLQVTPLKSESQYLSESKSVYIGVTSIPNGVSIVFGSVPSLRWTLCFVRVFRKELRCILPAEANFKLLAWFWSLKILTH